MTLTFPLLPPNPPYSSLSLSSPPSFALFLPIPSPFLFLSFSSPQSSPSPLLPLQLRCIKTKGLPSRSHGLGNPDNCLLSISPYASPFPLANRGLPCPRDNPCPSHLLAGFRQGQQVNGPLEGVLLALWSDGSAKPDLKTEYSAIETSGSLGSRRFETIPAPPSDPELTAPPFELNRFPSSRGIFSRKSFLPSSLLCMSLPLSGISTLHSGAHFLFLSLRVYSSKLARHVTSLFIFSFLLCLSFQRCTMDHAFPSSIIYGPYFPFLEAFPIPHFL